MTKPVNKTRDQWRLVDARFCADTNSAAATMFLIEAAQGDIERLYRENDELRAERDEWHRLFESAGQVTMNACSDRDHHRAALDTLDRLASARLAENERLGRQVYGLEQEMAQLRTVVAQSVEYLGVSSMEAICSGSVLHQRMQDALSQQAKP